MFAGCPEAPGDVLRSAEALQAIRGMGSLAAMKSGSAAPYGHTLTRPEKWLRKESRPERSDNLRGSGAGAAYWRYSVGHGLPRSGQLGQLREKARFIRVSPAGQRGEPHDVVELKTAT